MNYPESQDSSNNGQIKFKNGDVIDLYVNRIEHGGASAELYQNGKLVRVEVVEGRNKPTPMKNVTDTIKNVDTKKLLAPKESFFKRLKNNIQRLIKLLIKKSEIKQGEGCERYK